MTDQLARFAEESSTVDSLAAQSVEVALRLVGADHAGITFAHALGRFVGNDPLVRQADLLQQRLCEGPGLEAPTVVAADVGHDPRWPRWGPAVAELGLRSLLSAQLRARGRRVGVLTLYGRQPRQFSGDDVTSTRLLAAQTATALAAAIEEEQLRTALHTRSEIGQAQGLLMERFGIDADHAFAVLRRYSQTTNTKLVDIAAHLVRTRELPSSAAPATDRNTMRPARISRHA